MRISRCKASGLNERGVLHRGSILPLYCWRMGQRHHVAWVQGFELVVAPDLTPAPRASQTMAQAKHVACN